MAPNEEASDDLVEDLPPQSLQNEPVGRLSRPKSLLRMRFHLTQVLLWITAFLTVSAAALAVWGPSTGWSRLDAQIGFLLTPFHTLLGIAIGYYFADKSRQE